MSLVANEPKTTTTSKNKAPTLKYFFEESGYNITVLDSLVATGKVTKENLSTVLERDDITLSECNGNSLVVSTIAPNGLIKNIGYFSANDSQELFKEDIPKAYQVIKDNILIESVSNEDFIESWAV